MIGVWKDLSQGNGSDPTLSDFPMWPGKAPQHLSPRMETSWVMDLQATGGRGALPGSQTGLGLNSGISLIGCVTFDRLPNFSGLQFPHL